jgi:leucyl aminopeptidase
MPKALKTLARTPSRLTVHAQSLSALTPHAGQDLVLFVSDDLQLAPSARTILSESGVAALENAFKVEEFKGKKETALRLTLATGEIERVLVIGLGKSEQRDSLDWPTLGGYTLGQLKAKRPASIILDIHEKTISAANAAEFALGARLRAYRFDRYKTKKKDDDESSDDSHTLTLHVEAVDGFKKEYKIQEALGDGICLARDLVNEPPNVLHPESFAEQAEILSKLGVIVEILDEKALKKIGMRMLLAVGQGSKRESRVAIMRWNGAAAETAPVAFIGKGVTCDTGGISIKPAQNMEDMKGDMAGAGCVVGLMHTLAARKAKVNAIGVIGLVENMPDGHAQRPGDIVTSLSGQTVEIINTDAEGRLVLGDILWYVQETYKPQFMINLATLTGAILVALAQEHAGLFSNNDDLAHKIAAAGDATKETVWRMPLSPVGEAYDKLIDSKNADMKNTGGRYGGSVTAAQFLQRFVNGVPWAHLDIAGTSMSSPKTEINHGWANGWGVRLLDALVRRDYEG